MNYADPTDQAAAAAQQRLDDAIKATLAAGGGAKPLPDIGECHYCQEPTQAGHRFCDADCRGDYDYMWQRRKANA